MKAIVLLILLIFPVPLQAETLQFFGDVLLSRGIKDAVVHEGVKVLWKGTEEIFSRDAIRVVNLEGAIGEKSSCTEGHTICFPIDSKTISVLSKFDVVSLANNHSLDLGPKGRNSTMHQLSKMRLIPLGGKQYSTSIETGNGSIGIVTVTDVVNSQRDKKYLTMADSPEVIQEIQRLKKLVGLVAVYIHWGRELDDKPTARMRQLAARFINAGTDIVVGHHPHVVGKAECIDGRPVVYSLGNFIFDQKYEETKKGAVLQCSRAKDATFQCRLIAIETPMNSFTPYLATKENLYSNENNVLASCIQSKPPIWDGAFPRNRINARYTLKREERNKSLFAIQRLNPNGSIAWESPGMPIDKMQTVDLDGNGIREVMLIQNIFSTLDNEVGKRVYIYSLNDGFKALWRGSGLSRPLLDAAFYEFTWKRNLKPILIALHSTDSFLVRNSVKSGCVLMSYRWNGFGFTGIKEKYFKFKADRISLSKDNVRLIASDDTILGEIDIAEII